MNEVSTAIRSLAGKASFQLAKFILFLTRIFPLKFTFALCPFIVFVVSRLKWEKKNIALNNLKIVFPDKTDKERKVIFRESLRNLLKGIFEMAFIFNGKYSAKEISKMASGSGLEHLDKLKKKGQGALLYSGHFGNFPLMIIWLAIKGYPVAIIYKEAKNFSDNFYGKIFKKFNVTPLKYKLDVTLTALILRSLKENKIVLILNDQSYPGGIYVNFFGKSVPSARGPVILAKRAGVPIIPAYICRDINNRNKITILPEILMQQENDPEKFVIVNTQILIDWIAKILISHPTEWLWLHNRWKRAKNQ